MASICNLRSRPAMARPRRISWNRRRVSQLHRSIGEAVQFFQRENALFELAQHHPSTGGAQVYR
jgi:hypothetical protein